MTESVMKLVTEAIIQTIDGYEKDTVIYNDRSCKTVEQLQS